MKRTAGFFGGILTIWFGFSGIASIAGPVEVSIPAGDGFELKGDVFEAKENGPGVLLLHQCSVPEQMNRKSLGALAENFHQRGFTVLTLDFRGFGDSTSQEFNLAALEGAAVFQKRGQAFGHFVSDTRAAFEFLRNQDGVDPARLAVFGASCGGAMALRTALENEGVKAAVLLSPFFGEPWIREEHWQALERSSLGVLAVAANEDTANGIFENAKRAATLSREEGEFIEYEGNAHGVPLFTQDPGLEARIVSWVTEHLTGPKEE